MSPVLLDYYSETNYNTSFKITKVFPSPTNWGAIGQALIITTERRKLASIKFYLKKVGLPIAKLVVRVYTPTGTVGVNARPSGNPTDIPLAESDEVECTSLSINMSLIEFTFSGSNKITFEANMGYCFLVLPKSATTLDANNYFEVGADWLVLSHAGNICALLNGAWAGGSSYDVIFYLYGDIIEEEKQYITDATTDWIYDYSFSHVPTEKIRSSIISHVEETKRIKGKVSQPFEETRQIKSKVGLKRFEETNPISSQLIICFEETRNITAPVILKFEEARLVQGDITWMFTLTTYTKIKAKTISKERELLDELRWL